MTVLVADDETTTLLLFARFLRDLPHRLVSCSNGLECLALWRTEKPSIVFLDLKMPGKTGDQLARIFRDEDPGHRCRRVAMSSLSARDAGINPAEGLWDDFLDKPVSRAALLFFVAKHLPHS